MFLLYPIVPPLAYIAILWKRSKEATTQGVGPSKTELQKECSLSDKAPEGAERKRGKDNFKFVFNAFTLCHEVECQFEIKKLYALKI